MNSRRIGFLLVGNESWMGGVYYVMNIIKELDKLPVHERPEMYVFYYRETPQTQIQELSQMHSVTVLPIFIQNIFQRLLNGLSIRIFAHNFWLTKYFDKLNLNVIYPWLSYDSTVSCKAKKVCWIPDFQHHFLPEYFTERERQKRDIQFSEIAEKSGEIIFSSKNALAHFKEIYPGSKAITQVFNFSSEAANVGLLEREEVLSQFGINKPYFIVCNQFWKHKNHKLVFDAMAQLKRNSKDFTIVFTGKQEDYRHPEYIKDLFEFFNDSRIDNALFLGFLGRVEQLSLMKYSQAVIQPSLFEGWGTVIEDAKALGVPVLASDIPIHREQLGEMGYYFNKNDSKGLSWFLQKHIQKQIDLIAERVQVKKVGEVFCKLLLQDI